ncbi:MAG TPA: hypothetical protein VGH12_01770 [Steroidobacteraceae bacterium]
MSTTSVVSDLSGLLAACDIVVAAEHAKFAFTEVRLGIIPAVVSPSYSPRSARLRVTEEAQEGFSAFFAKRHPNWRPDEPKD